MGPGVVIESDKGFNIGDNGIELTNSMRTYLLRLYDRIMSKNMEYNNGRLYISETYSDIRFKRLNICISVRGNTRELYNIRCSSYIKGYGKNFYNYIQGDRFFNNGCSEITKSGLSIREVIEYAIEYTIHIFRIYKEIEKFEAEKNKEFDKIFYRKIKETNI